MKNWLLVYLVFMAVICGLLVAIYVQAKHLNNNITAFSGWLQENFNSPVFEYEEDNSGR